MVRKSDWIITLVLIVIFLFVFISFFSIVFKFGYYSSDLKSPGSKIAVVDINGPIFRSERIVKQLKKYGKERSVKGIVLRLETPGGSVSATQEIYEEVRKVKEKGKKIVASMGNVAASGGYYIACGADVIMANPGTITGSIGVIAEFPNLVKLYDKLGIKFETIKSGKFKDTGSPNRNMSDEEKKYLQGLINDSYGEFLKVVMKERKLPEEKALKLADGRIYSGKMAKNFGLIDTLGTFEDAISLAKKLADVREDARVIREKRRIISLFDILFGDIDEFLFRMRKNIRLDYIIN